MTTKQTAPSGSWKSPITADQIIAGTVTLDQIQFDGDKIYWIEGRPEEQGRYAIVERSANGTTRDVLPMPWNARTRVHEYGGAAYAIHQKVLYFTNFEDQRLYRLRIDGKPIPLTRDTEIRFADMVYDQRQERLLCVREDHRVRDQEAVNTIVSVSVYGESEGDVLLEGADFYSSPRISPDGQSMIWIQWNHPNMPWDGTELYQAPILEDGTLGEKTLIAGGTDEAIFQPEWSPTGVIYFVSDRSGWWNLYRYPNDQVEALCPREAEFGRPQWVFGMRTYAFLSEDRMACTWHESSGWHLGILDLRDGSLQPVGLPSMDYQMIQAMDDRIVCVAGSASRASAMTSIDLMNGNCEILRESMALKIDPSNLSIAQPLEYRTENNLTAHAFYYPPTNARYQAPEDEKPPLLVYSHGGPTGAASSALNLLIQYWTSRGFAVVDVNYGGSTGYGKAYRERLNGQWGIVDIDDCANAAKYLAEQGMADGNRLAIRGRSAGGYTTLGALTFRDVFNAGASHFGVSDLEALVKETHKFESRYLDGLIGPYPEAKAIYDERSPIHHTDQLSCPVILLQGLEDKIVLPNQAELMVEALRDKGLPVAYVAFEGEQHGFRKASNIKRSLEAELYFYSRVFKFELAEQIDPVEIENL